MRRSVWGILALVVVTAALFGAFATVAGATQQNPECLTCHETLDTWSVGPVVEATACKKCHTPGLLGTHPYHNPGNCKVCHSSWGDSNRFAIPSWSGAEGSFSSATSKDTSSSILHVIHATPRWMSGVSTSVSECGSCHNPAACNACHSAPPSAKHSAHASTGTQYYPKHDPWTGTVAHGIVGEDQTQKTATTGPIQCATAGCHDLGGTQSRTAEYKESHTYAPRADDLDGNTVALSGSWKLITAGPYTFGAAQQSNYANSSITATFTGTMVEVVTDKDPYRGKAEVWLDGVYKADINCYAPTTQYEQIVWRSADLASGNHTVKVVVKGTQDPAARGAWVRLDAFRIYSSMKQSIAPKCTSCHPDKTSAHGTSYSHEASLTAGNEAGFTCNQCHDLKMITEHKRPSAVTAAAQSVCDQCHTTYAPYNLTTPAFNFTCGWNPGSGLPGCHQAANSQAPHTNINPSHDSTATESADCRTSGCHGNDLRAIHNNSIATNAYVTNCLTCHGVDKYPTSTNCVDAACHVASGVISMDTHPTPAHLANPAGAEALRTGGKTCATCHELELTDAHFNSQAKTVGSESILCSTCHEAAYLPAGWLGAPNNTCIACHPADATKAGAAHEAADYANKHDFTPFDGNQVSCGAGGLNQSFCHTVNAADFIHDPTNPRHTSGADCTSCHTAAAKASAAGVPSITTCTTIGCHTAAPHNMGRHLATASNECFRCHEKANGTVTNDVRDVHPSCETCHANPAYPGVTIGLPTADCVNCHKAGGVGGHAYSTPDPNHYVGSEGTHTASAQSGLYAGYNCTSCHNMELKPEHITKTKTNFAGVPLTYPDKCVACHEQRVDSLPGATWNKTCDQCHATKHTAQNAQHNATPDTLSGVLTSVTAEAEDFGTSTTWPADWQNWAPTYVTSQNTSAVAGYAGQIGVNATRTEYDFYKDINLSSYEGTAVLTFYYQVNVSNTQDFLVAEYSTNGGGSYTQLFRQDVDQLTWAKSANLNVPAGGTVRIRFRGTFNAAGEYGRVDDIALVGRQRGASPGTIGANCGGSGCHATGDVSAIHAESIPTNSMHPSCLTCHNPTAAQPKRDCNASGCHNGGHNMAVHTAVASPDCVGCHESNNVQAVHPTCNTCHANASYPNIVTGNTAECADCHNAIEVGKKVYDPADPQHYASQVTTHTALETGTFQTYQCTFCHYLELKPEHQKTSVDMPGYNAPPPVQKCIGCHETKVDAFTTSWDKRCASCHALTHGARATKHNASVIGASCGGTGCHNIADVSIIHNNSIATNGATMGDNNCATANCHADGSNQARPDSVPQTLDCMASGCHAGLVHSHSLDRTNSNYNNTTVTGCTNSGSGCHGSDTGTTMDYAQYHPTTGCTTGACHQGNASQADPAFNNPQTCQNCHGGRSTAPLIYDRAPDAVSLTTATPNGHYSETTHTAAGLLNTAKAKADGLTSAACTTCHNPINPNSNSIDGLWYQHQILQGLGNTTCYECHSNAAYPGVTAEVIGSWTTNACSDCHNVTDMPSYVQHATNAAPVVLGNVVQSAASPGACNSAGCHENLDLHELHKGNGVSGSGRPDPQCNVCHDPLKQGWKPVEKSCGDGGACHITQPHLNIGPAHSVTALSEACIECHETTDLRLNHGFATTCSDASATGCHNGSVPGLPTPIGKQECVDCHTPGVVGTHVYAPHDDEHYKGTETTHTATAQTGTYGAVTSVIGTEGFNAATFPAAWTKSSTRVIANNVSPYEGTYYAQIYNTNTTRQTDYFQKVFDTSNASSPTVSFYYQTLGFASPDYARLEYSTDGSTFTQMWNVTAIQSTWTTVGPLAVPRSATLTLRWSASTNANNSDMLRVDKITVKPGDGDPAACSACHNMQMRPEHFKASSDATRVPSIYGDKCVDCHENKVDAIGTAWDHKCTSCHPVSTQHNDQAPKHDASAVAPECGGSGCHYIQDVSVIHNNSSTHNPLYTNCTNTCHKSASAVPTTIDCDSAGCHAGVEPHTHELDVTASDYNNTTVTGCTDSGAGCHGSLVATSYVDYHPNSGCTTGPCHTAANHNDQQFNNPNSCQNCHGGGPVLHDNAPDVVGITEATPNGHYSETTHTAVASSRTATMSAGGTITARCIDCHNDVSATGIDGLFAQHQGLPAPYTNTGCWECHSNPAYPLVTTEVKTANWTTNTCADCHKAANMGAGFAQHSNTAPAVTATEAQGAGSCQTTGCHTTLDLHALHKGSASTPPARAAAGCALAGCHDYSKQGRKPTGKSCGVGGTCHTATPTHPNETAAHQTIDTGTCARCHEGVANTVFTDIRDVYKSVGFGNVPAHTCASCHNGGTNLGATNTADCVDCHNATEQGGHAYAAYDPNHYYTASHDSSSTSTDNWSTANYGTTLLDYHGSTVNYSRACTSCHTIDLLTEHNKTSVSYNLGGKPDKCVACHEGNGVIAGVDNWSARWTGGCGGEASNCHNMSAGVLHNNAATKHNASTEVMTAPGSAFTGGAATTVATDDFGTTTTWPGTFTRSSTTYVTAQTGSARAGAAAQIGVNTIRTEYNFYKTAGYALTSYAGGNVSFWYQVNVSDTADFLVCEYSTATGGPWTELYRVNTDVATWTQSPTLSLPGGSTIYVRFRGTFNATGEYGRVDDVVVSGTSAATLGAALPANSNAATSCSSNPNATQCHDVTDVADIHSMTPNSGCPICHTGTAQHPTNKNCQAAGCHVGINVNEHIQSGTTPDYHESPMASNAAGQPLATTGVVASWCTGCHDDSIANEHFVLGPYGSQPCSMCHKKSTNSGAPSSVTSADTSATIHGDATANNELCTDCHKTVTKAAIHVQRAGNGGTPGTQFNDNWSGHKIYDTMPGAKTSFTTAADGVSANRTWTLPTATTWLKTGWTTTTMAVRCSDCHGSLSAATGPHGGAMQVKMASGYDNTYSTTLYLNGTSMSNTTNICAKCHTTTALGYNNVHSRGDHQGSADGKCINCHVKIPHAWKRPRLIGYRNDPAPYATLEITSITDRGYTPTGWSKSYCGVGGSCGSHSGSATTPLWP